MRRRFFRSFAAGSIAVLMASAAWAQAPRVQASEKIPNQYVVVLNDSVDSEAASADLARGQRIAVMQVFKTAIKGFSALIPPGRLGAVRGDPRVKSVSADRTVHAWEQVTPKGIDRIDAEPGAAANDGAGVNVAVIDTGIDLQHADLAANVAGGVTLVTGEAATTTGGQDDEGHGSHVAGTIAAAVNSVDVVGAAPGAALWAVKVLDSRGSGSFSDVIAGIDWVMDTTAHPSIGVVNMSLGATCSDCTDGAGSWAGTPRSGRA